MDKLSGNRFAPGCINPPQQSHAIDHRSALVINPYPDLIIISLDEDRALEHFEFCAQAKHCGLSFEALVIEQADGSDLPKKIEALHAEAKLGPGTQVIIKMHGLVQEGRHWLGTSVQPFIDTSELMRLLRCPPGSSRPVGQWKGVIHLISCHIAAAGELMRDRLGYCVFYGGHETTLAGDGIETVKEMMRLVGLSKQQSQQQSQQQDGNTLNATSLFPYLAGFTGEPITLAGNGRCEFIHPFDAEPVAFGDEKSETERWMRIFFSRLDHGTHAEVKEILDTIGPQLASTMKFGSRPLHIVAGSRSDSRATAEVLLKAGADINALDDDGSTALMDACRYGRSKMVTFLLMHGADPEIANARGEKVIDFAIELDRRHIVIDLVKAGADINWPDRKGISPFLHVCLQKNVGLAEIMLTVGSPDLALCTPFGETALHLACDAFEPDLVELMLRHGADPLMPDDKGVPPLERALVRGNRMILQALAGDLFDEFSEMDITALLALAEEISVRSAVEEVIKFLAD